MKNRIITLLVLFILLAPVASRAMIALPMINLTTTVNTQGQDASFNFNLDSCSGVFCDRAEQFDLQTQNLSGSNTTSFAAFGDKYILTEENISGLKVDSISCSSNNSSASFSYGSDDVIFSSAAWSNVACTFNNVKVQEKTPILIVPGLMGTEMKDGSDLLWPDIDRMVNPTNSDGFMDPLEFSMNLAPSDSAVSVSDVIRKATLLGAPVYDYVGDLINEFENQGYTEGENLFTFPYDWRYGVSGKFADGTTNMDLLATKIQDILQQTGSNKVDVVAHSLGGLIVKKYVIDHPTDHHIGKAVFVGVPNTGAPKAIKALLQGDNFGVLGLNDQEMKKIAANMPSAYDLLPTQKYYDAAGSFVSSIDIGYGMGVSEPTEKDLNYGDFESYLSNKGLNSTAATNSENLHTADFDNFDLRTAGISLYAIDGCKSATMTNFLEVKYKDILGKYHTDYDNVELKAGDNTVPLESATNLPIDPGNKYYALVSDHGKMPSEDGIRQEIINLLSGSNLPVSGNLITQDITKCNLNGKAISVFSPINIFATDQSGNRLGLADDGSIINEIPNADFEIWGEHKFVYLPQDNGQIYNISLNGTNTGDFTIKSKNISNNQITGTEVFSNLPVTPALVGQINIGSDNTTTLSLNGSPTPVLPSATLGALTSEDVLPSVSVATLTGTAGQPNFYRSNVSVNIKATDDLSGVLGVQYNLDNHGYLKIQGDNANVAVLNEGKHTLTFFSTDKAGNNEPEQNIIFTIDKTAPEAIIQFDPGIQDMKFSGADNISDSSLVSVSDKDNVIILTDQAGNTTEIDLKNKNRKILMSAEIKSLKYNGVAADVSKNVMAYLWLYDKKKNLIMLTQHVQSKNGYNILAVYNGKNTSLVGKDSSGKIVKSANGLKIIKITTNKGDLGWSY